MEEKDVIGHIIDMKTDIASIKTTLEETVQPLVLRVGSQETRLGGVEGDVKTIKRVWGTLFSLLLVSMGVVTAWVKGLFNG